MNPNGTTPLAQEIEDAYAAHGDALFRFCLRLCGSRDDAEDVVVETFAHAYRRWNEFRGQGSRRSWLFGIAVNRARMARRRFRPTESLSDDTPDTGMHPMELIALDKEIARLLRPKGKEKTVVVSIDPKTSLPREVVVEDIRRR